MHESGVDYATKNYPENFPIAFSHAEFPSTRHLAEMLGMPLGFMLTPYQPMSDKSHLTRSIPRLTTSAHYIARCSKCAAYINPFCDASNMRWLCSLCGHRNSFTRSMVRYRQIDLRLLPEMQSLVIDYPLPLSDEPREVLDTIPRNNSNDNMYLPAHAKPLVHVFLIQEDMPVDCLTAVLDALVDAVEAMHDDMEILLITYSTKLSVYRFHNDGVCVQHVHFTAPSTDGSVSVCSSHDITFSNKPLTISVPLFSVGEFLEVACPLHVCRSMLVETICSLLEISQSAQHTAFTAIGLTLESVLAWILHSGADSTVDSAVVAPTESTLTGVLDFFSAFGFTQSNSNHIEKSRAATTAELCSGIILHIFSSNVASEFRSDGNAWDEYAIKSIAATCCKNGIGCNIWSVVSFESQTSALNILYPLAATTGGQVYNYVLGTEPALERSRLSLQLARTLGSTVATKTLLKIRQSSFMEQNIDLTGHTLADSELPGIYRMALCSPELAVAGCVEYNSTSKENEEHPSGNFVLQVAFSYNSMVESDEVNEGVCADDQNRDTDQATDVTKRYLSRFVNVIQPEGGADVSALKKQTTNGAKLSGNRNENRCSNRSRLVAVRRLRIISVMIECIAKLPRVVRCSNPSVIVMLLMRQAFSTVNSDLKSHMDRFKQWSCAMVLAVAKGRVKLGSSATENTANTQNLVADAMKLDEVMSMLRYAFSCMHYISQQVELLHDSNRFVEIRSLILRSDNIDAMKLFYPNQYMISVDNGKTLYKLLPLRREALTTSNARLILLDCGIELIVYRALLGRQDENWNRSGDLLNGLIELCERKISVAHSVPRLLFSEAGKMSSIYFTNQLIEEASTCGGFVKFCQQVEQQAVEMWIASCK